MTDFYVAGHTLIERNNKYLVTKRSKLSTYMPLKWDIPGGIVKQGETLEEAIYREVGEETNLTIQVERVIYIYANRDQLPIRQTFQAIYLSKYKDGEIRLNPLEHDMYQWLDYDDIANVDMIDFLRELVKAYHPETI
ncbi:MAG: NUDIX hydrolase [Candidatus Bathyarchaeota archaeon]|nr:NUDIX hydrolase [Candidatus Bathyarchaeota archaeon]